MRAGNITIFLSLTTALLSIIQLLINFLMKCTCRCLLADVQQKKTPSEEKCQIVCLRRENGKKNLLTIAKSDLLKVGPLAQQQQIRHNPVF